MTTDLVGRLRGTYSVGPIQANGEPEFGHRNLFEGTGITPPAIDLEAADRIEQLEAELAAAKLDADRLTTLERALRTGNHLGLHKKWFSLKGFTNYEYDVFPTLREAIDGYTAAKGGANG
ncbi:MAG: hypothetical protein WKG03_03705 [Telluria sp.]